jgi:hypothetical protein
MPPVNGRLFDIAWSAYKHDEQHSPQKVHEEISLICNTEDRSSEVLEEARANTTSFHADEAHQL